MFGQGRTAFVRVQTAAQAAGEILAIAYGFTAC